MNTALWRWVRDPLARRRADWSAAARLPGPACDGVDASCSRVDDECRFDADGMEIVALFGEPGHELVFFTWWAFEGQSVTLLKNQDGTLVGVRRAYRYHAPS